MGEFGAKNQPEGEHPVPTMRTVNLFSILRLIVAALVVGAGVMIIQVTNEGFPVRPLYTLLALCVVSGGAVYAAIVAGVPFRAGVWMITVADVVLESAMIHYSGGTGSQFSIIYCLTIVAAAFLLEIPGGLGSAALASTLFVGYGAMQTAGAIQPPALDGLSTVVRPIGLLSTYMHVSLFFLVGGVGGYLAHRINQNRRELASAETRLQQLKIDTDIIVSNMSSGVLVIDSDGFIVTLNPSAERILGVSGEDVLMRNIETALGRVAPPLVGEVTGALTRAESKLRHEILLEKEDGSEMPLGVSISVLRDHAGQARGIILVFQDLTEVREMRERVRKADRLAAIGALSAGIAHEIRNPLASISGSIELLYNDLELDGENRRLMELIMRESDRLDAIITDFLNFAKLRAPRKRPVDLHACLDDVVTLVRNNAAMTEGVAIHVSVADDLAPVRVDDEQIRQVFFNLVINSCEAMEDGGRVDIAIDHPDGDSVRVVFEDRGPGIDAGDAARLFEPFFTTKDGGTGLGLAIANKIVTAHGGTIAYRDREGGGAAFVVTMPAGRVEPARAGTNTDRKAAPVAVEIG